jgi:hypothetical protein
MTRTPRRISRTLPKLIYSRIGGNQRDTDRAKAQKKLATLNKGKAKESATSLQKVCLYSSQSTSIRSHEFLQRKEAYVSSTPITLVIMIICNYQRCRCLKSQAEGLLPHLLSAVHRSTMMQKKEEEKTAGGAAGGSK